MNNKKSVQTVLKEMFPNKEFIVRYAPSYLKNKVPRYNKKIDDIASTNRQLSISYYCEELKFGVCCTSVPLGTWHDVDESDMDYYYAVDKFKVSTCKDNGDFVVILPIIMEDTEVAVRAAYEQYIASLPVVDQK